MFVCKRITYFQRPVAQLILAVGIYTSLDILRTVERFLTLLSYIKTFSSLVVYIRIKILLKALYKICKKGK